MEPNKIKNDSQHGHHAHSGVSVRLRIAGWLGASLLLLSIVVPLTAAQATKSAEPEFAIVGRVVPALADGQSATLLPSGQWLLLGGQSSDGHALAQAQLFDPHTGMMTPVSNKLSAPRAHHSASVLPDGSVLILGGEGEGGKLVSTAERYQPATQQFEAVADVGLIARAHHTATLLMDGKLLIVGGRNARAQTLDDAELLDTATLKVEPFNARLDTARFAHVAALLPSDYVLLWAGKDTDQQPLNNGELYDRLKQEFRKLEAVPDALPAQSYAATAPELRASLPAADSANIAVDARIALRFSKPLLPETLTAEAVTLIGPAGKIDINVIAAERGTLAFVTPKQQLLPGSRYTLFVQGAKDEEGRALPLTAVSFNTAVLGQTQAGNASPAGNSAGIVVPSALAVAAARVAASSQDDEDEEWIPDARHFNGNWKSGRAHLAQRSTPKQSAALRAAPGVTAVAGQVLRLNGRPLANVTLAIGTRHVRTDDNGEFLLTDIPHGTQTLVIDASSADQGNRHYGRYEYRLDAKQGETTALPFVIWMAKLDTAHHITITSPTKTETVITNPAIPGLELRIPAGTVIRDVKGNIVTDITMTAIPIDQPPFPLPNREVPVYFTLQPGGAHLQGLDQQTLKGARLIYPNFAHLAPGARMDFWNYDPRDKGWYVYGQGSVSKDGKQIVPDAGVAIYEFTGAMLATEPGLAAAEGTNWCPVLDPVDCYTGLFLHERTDLTVPGILPLEVRRVYRTRDAVSRAFGIGANLSYDLFLVGDVNPYTFADLILPDGARLHFVRTSPGTSYADAVYRHTATPTKYYGATIFMRNDAWVLTLTDGSTVTFPDGANSTTARCAAAIRMSDRQGNAINITRDSRCNVTRVTSPLGRNTLTFTYDGADRITQVTDDIGRTATYQYDASGRLIKATDPLGNFEEYTYDTNHNMISVKDKRGNLMVVNEYDVNARVKKQTYPDSTTATLAYTLNGAGKVAQTDITDERGVIKRIAFNANGFSTSITRAVGKPEQQITTYNRDSVTNLVNSETDALNRVTAYQYDTQGNRTQVTKLSGTAEAKTWTYTYEPTFSRLTSITDPLNHTTTFTYDALGNVIQMQDALNNKTTLAYNSASQPTRMTRQVANRLLTTTYTYDNPQGGDLARITDPLGRATELLTDRIGRVLSTVDPAGNTTRNQYDNLNRLTNTTDPAGNNVQYGYDELGNLTRFTDANSHVTLFGYDARNRLTTKTDALNQTETYAYDDLGNLTKLTDRKGQVSGFTYDFLNRKISAGFGATIANPTAYQRTVSYTLDAGNRVGPVIDSISGTIARIYDNLNRLTRETTPEGQVDYSYYANGLRQTQTVAGQSAINYTYDDANRLTQLTQGATTTSLSYDEASRRTQVVLPNGVEMNYTYDDANQLTGITYKKGAAVLGDLTYSYDATGNRTAVGGSFASTNLPVASTASYDINNRLTNRDGATLSYDLNGNLTADGAHAYTWDSLNRLTAMDGNTFQYDAFGRRTSKTVGGTQTGYLYDGANFVQELTGSTPNANIMTGQGYDEFFSRNTSAGTRYPLTDALGSVIAFTDAAGNIVTNYSFSPYGETTTIGSADTNSQQYTGRENDGTGLYYYRARYYSPQLGRFISEDPIGLKGGLNTYAYVENNPLRWVDPDGLTGRAPGHAPPYNRAPGVGLPSIPVHNMLVCIQSCLGVPFTITSTYRPGPGQGEHGTGGAADARYRGPGTGPFSSGNFLCCAARCGAGYGLDEYDHPSPGATAPHLHIQRAPGRNGGRGDLPLPGCEPNQCGK